MIAEKWVLSKISHPGWDKEFDTEAGLLQELRLCICTSCMAGQKFYVGEDEAVSEPPPDANSISSLLGTACGCEYWVVRPGEEIG